MKITFVGHASVLIETCGISILSDPWWNGPCFGAQWWNYPAAAVDSLQAKRIDYMYISHGHHDHLHPGTLKTLPRNAKVLVSSSGDLAPSIRELGFTVVEVEPQHEMHLSDNVRVRIMPTHNDDTLFAITDGNETCINLNDALHSTPRKIQDHFVSELRTLYPRSDYVFCGYGVASHFPNCYRLPGKDAVATAGNRQRYFNRQWARIMNGLSPRFAFPFAADVVFLARHLQWVNEPTHNTERPTATLQKDFPGFAGTAIDIAPGFEIEDGRVVRDLQRRSISDESLRRDLAGQIDRANRLGVVEWTEVLELRTLLEQNVAACYDYLADFAGDYCFLIRFRNSCSGVTITKSGTDISVDALENADDVTQAQVMFTTRLPYLRWSLTTKYGGEIIFVGSGGIFDYKSAEDIPRALHRELATIIRKHERMSRRAIRPSKLIRGAKALARNVLGMETIDLYDLYRWTIFRESAERTTPDTSR